MHVSLIKIAIKLPNILIATILSLSVSMFAPLAYTEMELLLPQKGMCYITWDKEQFASRYSDESLKKLTSLGVEYLSICVTQYQERYNSLDIERAASTPSDRSLIHVIKKAHNLGAQGHA